MFATDLSDASIGALHYARQLAQCFSSKMLVVHVIEATHSTPGQTKPHLADLMSSAEDELEAIVGALSSDGIRCAMIVRAGGIRKTVMDLIDEREVDLLVIGTRGMGHKDQEGLGSVAEKLLRAAPCPVLTVGHFVRQDAWENTHRRSVLLPTDFTEASRVALEYAERLTRHLTGRLLLLHVDESYANPQHPKREEEFREFLKGVESHPGNTECMVRDGIPADTIIAVSKDNWVDFIVMSVHGTDQEGRAHNYGTAYEVIRLARCPVITIHIQEKVPEHNSDNRLKREITA
jgi:nucleotide-binding universal stress UspA family protein